jgi:hypothetical protein
MQSYSNVGSVLTGRLAVIVTTGSLLIGLRSVAVADRASQETSRVSITASGIALKAQPDGTLQVTDRSGAAKLVLATSHCRPRRTLKRS